VFHVHRLPRRRVRTGTGRSVRRGLGWLRPLFLAGMLATLPAVGAISPALSLPSLSAQPQLVQPGNPANPQPVQEMPLDGPLRMLREAQQRYQSVVDYQCILITQERVGLRLLPQNVMQVSFKKTPFSIYMKWLAPKDKEGQEVCYVQGRNQNMMRVHAASGLGGAFGFINIAINDPKVLQNSRHYITEAGFGNAIERCAKSWEAERILNKTQVNVAEYEYNKRRCIRIETIHLAQHPTFYSYRNVIYLDKETKLPVRMESYDWPRQNGPPEGDLLECFSYVDVQLNVGIPDSVFNH